MSIFFTAYRSKLDYRDSKIKEIIATLRNEGLIQPILMIDGKGFVAEPYYFKFFAPKITEDMEVIPNESVMRLPWVELTGEVNKEVLKQFLYRIGDSIYKNPGIPLKRLRQTIMPMRKAVFLNLVSVLERNGVIYSETSISATPGYVSVIGLTIGCLIQSKWRRSITM